MKADGQQPPNRNRIGQFNLQIESQAQKDQAAKDDDFRVQNQANIRHVLLQIAQFPCRIGFKCGFPCPQAENGASG